MHLSVALGEVNTYGEGHINRYTTFNNGVAYRSSNGYGGMAYYTSETCGYINGEYIYEGCKTEYEASDIKYVVDNWAIDKFLDKLKIINGYSARLITKEEFSNYAKNNELQLAGYGGFAWTMSSSGSTAMYSINGVSISSEHVTNFRGNIVRPVINVKKSAIEKSD